MNIDGESSFCNNEEETINDIFMNCELAYNVWLLVVIILSCNMNFQLTNWMEYIWTQKS